MLAKEHISQPLKKSLQSLADNATHWMLSFGKRLPKQLHCIDPPNVTTPVFTRRGRMIDAGGSVVCTLMGPGCANRSAVGKYTMCRCATPLHGMRETMLETDWRREIFPLKRSSVPPWQGFPSLLEPVMNVENELPHCDACGW